MRRPSEERKLAVASVGAVEDTGQPGDHPRCEHRRVERLPVGLAAEEHSGPQRFRTGSRTGGTGLGLTIATGQARLLGARLTFRNRPEGGCGDGAAAADGLIRRRRGAPFGWAGSSQSAGVAPLVGGVDVCG
ncbi:hypothetical protein GCM10022233_42740 [Streptomyces shaanxiensis]|uniref:Uncharacterized protein n=1 Tax=Streptomyces shaanxiensis TaxID=653357 RepID=A0ABP7VC24_9ACTN